MLLQLEHQNSNDSGAQHILLDFSFVHLSKPNLDAILSVKPYVYAEWIYRHTYIHV